MKARVFMVRAEIMHVVVYGEARAQPDGVRVAHETREPVPGRHVGADRGRALGADDELVPEAGHKVHGERDDGGFLVVDLERQAVLRRRAGVVGKGTGRAWGGAGPSSRVSET
eukprot:TRINITY_DN47646_c0_g1_i1.p2 TRINITY_DN47646_c0_g1~~TRINITY_DN47646_c0_g1_i1.p2  ORF type:complete len:113 (-),score=4.79 TRINITY_DN47646_c0_g1_i1:27-365(-)